MLKSWRSIRLHAKFVPGFGLGGFGFDRSPTVPWVAAAATAGWRSWRSLCFMPNSSGLCSSSPPGSRWRPSIGWCDRRQMGPHDLHVPVLLLHPHPLSKQPVLGEVRVVPVPRGLGTRSTSICCNFPTHDLAASCWTICCR